ncbi:UTRA domain-containing protein [Streptomyces sp. CC53]|uniref:GntR family transcriptional regulator n=1 Tax=Streptomyces sp. CC53 TaxID=1906740 RepID=UPI0008DD18EF|nr:GntR family transcriptional regulator [Streptomyces sp. CC53]OII60188.1 UTRA domain-containing protein [Streptomyces sp. CC53]
MTSPAHRTTARSIADDLRAEIKSGTLKPGDVLPTSRELAEHYGVTLKTVGSGIDILKTEGLVIGEQGGRRRVRASRPIVWNLTRFERGKRRDSSAGDDWAAAIRDAGREPEQHVTVHLEQADSQVATWLQVPVGSEIVQRVRLRTVDGQPYQLSTSSFPMSIADGTPLLDEGDVSMPGGILSAIGHPQLHIRDEISIRMPSPEESEQLQLPPGTPVAEHVRIGYGEAGPVRVMVTIAPGDRHRLVYELEV